MLIVGIGTTGAHANPGPAPAPIIVRDGAHWYTQAYEDTPTGDYTVPEQSDVTGPQHAPYGTGSHKMTIGQYDVQTELYRTDDYDNTNLGDITRLEYSTFARSTSGGADRQPTYLRLTVDDDGNAATTGDRHSLFFFPGNNPSQQPVVNGEWQNWNVVDGLMNVDGDSGTGEISLADYHAAHTAAILVNNRFDINHDGGAVSLISGAANTMTNGEYFVDRVIVGKNGQDTLFDFGPNAETDGGTTQLTVDPTHPQGWAHQAYDDAVYLTSDQQFVTGPGTPPKGTGSLKMSLSTADNPDRVELFRTEQYDGTLVRDLRTLTYSTYSRANTGNNTPQQPAYLRLSVDNDGNGTTDASLFFYPANNGAPAQSTWQTWDAANGVWGVNGDQAQQSITLEDYVVAHPDATIVKNEDAADRSQVDGGLAFIVGGAGSSAQMDGEYFLDDIKISKVDAATGSVNSGKEFDLEPTPAGGGGGGGGTTEPSVSIGDAQVSEGNAGATLTFPVTVANPSSQPVTVHYATTDGTAKAGSDYTATSGDLTIPAGQTTGHIDVPVLSDTVNEPDETLTVTLTSPGYGTLGDDSATGTITNDDAEPAVSVGDAQVSEGNSGATLSFPVTVANPSSQAVTVHYATSDGTAKAGSDYTATSGDLTIPAGQTTGHIDVPVLSDTVEESDETLTVTVTPAGYGTVTDGSATGTIVNDDEAPGPTNPAVIHPGIQAEHVPATDSIDGYDLITVNSSNAGADAMVKLYRVKDGVAKRVKSKVLGEDGKAKFKRADLNGDKKNFYYAVVTATDTNLRGVTRTAEVR
ncbi:hypothetical protein FB382_002794 [Nocardioides ginsengisegetis]|uniref:Calx-beta domain-containing protein n=1 Tax=Nocardioides ginsengisegetis TaxID=661491 RepID=A0A7W3J1D0_9ACTN|nr:Calx-beta domain-containing protein [Nocardioides ginsengisegetis]MBA8804503.1 hypothetical protein [Nocardioides ginsengisegetis]